MHSTMFGSILGLSPLDASSKDPAAPFATIKNVSRHCRMSPLLRTTTVEKWQIPFENERLNVSSTESVSLY